MKHLKSTKKSKHTRPLPMGKKSRGVLAVYAAVVFTVCCLPMTAFAAGNDPLAVINNLSDFIFGVIKAKVFKRSLRKRCYRLALQG